MKDELETHVAMANRQFLYCAGNGVDAVRDALPAMAGDDNPAPATCVGRAPRRSHRPVERVDAGIAGDVDGLSRYPFAHRLAAETAVGAKCKPLIASSIRRVPSSGQGAALS